MRGATYGQYAQHLSWSCGCKGHATAPACMRSATWHGLNVDTDEMMCSCDAHNPVMELCADWVHPMGSACFLPDSQFFYPENVCRMPPELSVERLAEVADLARLTHKC
jgi:hypothetical protein